jgi:hypothetical protein
LDYLHSEEDDTLDYFEEKRIGKEIAEDLKQFNSKKYSFDFSVEIFIDISIMKSS